MADTSKIIESGFFDSINRDRLYSADDMNKPYKDLISEGVYGAIVGSTSTAFAVSPGTGLKVSVAAGKALLRGRWVSLDEAEEFDVPSNSSGSSRTDSVILRVDVNNSVRASSLIYRTGSSEAPALVTTAGITEQRIANIIVANGASSISAGNITDERTFASLNVSKDQLEEVLLQIIEDHPELITTVADGSITTAKLADGAVTEAKMAAALLNILARIDGYYEDMTVGYAENIISTISVLDKDPYLFRSSGGTAEIGDYETAEGIDGYSIPWNQMAYNGNFASSDGWTARMATVSIADGIATVTPTSDGTQRGIIQDDSHRDPIYTSHRYFISATVKPPINCRAQLTFNGNGGGSVSMTANVWNLCQKIYSPTVDFPSGGVAVYIYESLTTSDTIQYKNINAIDLTVLFGSTIADYIYSLEQATEGAGVAWVRRYFPNDYYDFFEPDLKHIEGLQRHEMVGRNQWDEEWEPGIIYSNGIIDAGQNGIHSKNFNECLPSTSYYCLYFVCWYDENQNFISRGGYGATTSPSNARYFKISTASGYGTTYKNDICIFIHWDDSYDDAPYEPYEKHSYDLDSSVVLRGVLKIDEDGNLYADGDIYKPSGEIDRRYGIVDLGTLTWSYLSSYEVFGASLNGAIKPAIGSDVIPVCAKYVGRTPYYVTGMSDKQIMYDTGANAGLFVKDSAYTDAATFKTAMSGVYLVYELATPTTETADPFQQNQWVSNWGTEEYVTTEGLLPIGHETRYPISLREKAEAAPNNPTADGTYIVTYENGTATYTPLGASDTITSIIARLEALEGGTE